MYLYLGSKRVRSFGLFGSLFLSFSRYRCVTRAGIGTDVTSQSLKIRYCGNARRASSTIYDCEMTTIIDLTTSSSSRVFARYRKLYSSRALLDYNPRLQDNIQHSTKNIILSLETLNYTFFFSKPRVIRNIKCQRLVSFTYTDRLMGLFSRVSSPT